jgi:hypothetical protein
VGDDLEGFKYKVETVVTAGKDVSSFVDAFGKVKDAVTPKQTPGSALPSMPSDEAKIVASANDIETQLKPFMDMESARKYDALIRSFADISQARNNKILEYNNLLQTWQDVQADIQQTHLDADAAQDSLASMQNPFLGDAANFMFKAWIDSKRDLVRALYQVHRAYTYYSLLHAPFSIQDFSVSALTATAASIVSLYANSKAAFGSLPANIVAKEAKDSLSAFKKTGIVTVAIDPKEPSLLTYSNLLATRVWIELKGPNGRPKHLQVTLTHEGRALVYDQLGQAHTFSHVTVPVPYETYNNKVVTDGAVASGTSDYEGLSPYGPWTIHINAVDDGFLEKVEKISFLFDGKARGRP